MIDHQQIVPLGSTTPALERAEADPTSLGKKKKKSFSNALGDSLANFAPEFPVMSLDPNLAGQFNPLSPGISNRANMPPLMPISQRFSPINFGGYRHSGGRVDPLTGYIIKPGEEAFVPDRPGTIVPIDKKGQPNRRLNPDLPELPEGQKLKSISELSPLDQSGLDSTGLEMKAPLPPAPQEGQRGVPLSPLTELQQAKDALVQRGQQKVGWGSNALYGLFEGMKKFANPNGPDMQPLGQVRYQNELNKIDQRLKPLYDQRDQQVKYTKQMADAEAAQYDTTIKQLKALHDANPRAYETMMADQVITPEEANAHQQAGLGYIAPGDYRKFENQRINGAGYATPQIGAPNWQRDNSPVDPAKVETPLTVTIPGTNIPVATTGNEELNRANTRENANTVALGKAAETNRRIQDTDNQKAYETETKNTENIDKSVAMADESVNLYNQGQEYETQAQAAEQKLAVLNQKLAANPNALDADPSDRRALEKEISDLREKSRKFLLESKSKGNEAVRLSKTKSNPPKGTKAVPNLRPANKIKDDKVVTKQELEAVFQASQQSPNPMTREQLAEAYRKHGFKVEQ